MADHDTGGGWDLIVTPWHLDEHIPAFPIAATATQAIRPALPPGPVPARMSLLHQAAVDAVTRTARPLVLSGDCPTARAVVAGLQRRRHDLARPQRRLNDCDCAGRAGSTTSEVEARHQTIGPGYAFVVKNSSAVLVFVCCSPSRSTPRPDRKTRASAAAWKASEGRVLVDSSTIWEPSGYSHSSPTSLRPNPSGLVLSRSVGIGPSTDRSSSPMPSGA